jgi:competence protein ComEC
MAWQKALNKLFQNNSLYLNFFSQWNASKSCMDAKLFSFIAGTLTSLIWTSLPPIASIVLLVVVFWGIYKSHHCIAYMLLGIIWMASVGHWQGYLQLTSAQTSQPIIVKGQVASIVLDNKNIRFNLEVSCINQQCFTVNRRFRLSWREPSWQIQQGQVVALQVKVKPPNGLANQGGFHYQQWLFSEGIVATGYVKTAPVNQLLDNTLSIRQNLLNRMLHYDLSNKSWLAALAFGYRGLLQAEDWHLVQKTGVAHLIAISGLHLALVASLSYFLITYLGGLFVSRFERLHVINLHNVSILLSLLTTLFYAGLAGFGLPTLRAWIMLLLFSSFFLLNKNITAKRLILLGISCFILFFPLSIFGLSFWLSFCAVIIISFVFWRWPVKHASFSLITMFTGLLKLQISLTLLMLPLVAWQFSYVSFVSPLVNVIAVPFVTLLLVPICLVAVILLAFSPALSVWVFSLADLAIGYAITGLKTALQLDWAYFQLQAYPIWGWCALFILLVLSLLPQFWLSKKYLFLLVLPILSFIPQSRDNIWQVDILDVGQGVAVLITRGKRALIYDVGAKYPSGFNMADTVLLPILQAKGIASVDYVFISHGDNDHAGSLSNLQKGMDIKQLLTNKSGCKQGVNINWQGLSVQSLWPDDASQYNDNNGSCVIRIADQYHSVLLPGDIDKSIEYKLVQSAPHLLDADILLAPHHGSNTSSSSYLINTVSADFVVFSQGFMNRWQFPRTEVIDRYLAHNKNTQLFTTSDSGQVSFLMHYNSPLPIQTKSYRQQSHPYWYANFSPAL